MRIGVLAGTGFGPFEGAEIAIETPFGDVAARFERANGVEWVRLLRHAPGHRVPPHRVPYRANVEALARARVERVLATNSVGSLDPALPPGSFVVPDDYMDVSDRTERTLFDSEAVHVDVSEAYCPEVRRALVAAARAEGARVRDGGVYVATPGPRLETRAEARAWQALGGAIVGMTGAPEAALARERGLCYATLALVANFATGIGPGRVDAVAVAEESRALAPVASRILARVPPLLADPKGCACREAPLRGRIPS